VSGLLLLLALCAPVKGAERDETTVISRIPHETVESKAIASIGYSRRLHALEVEFRRGGTYRYIDVPPEVHRELIAAESKARYYNRCIRGKYRAIWVRLPRHASAPR
jgi:hypothetical protein